MTDRRFKAICIAAAALGLLVVILCAGQELGVGAGWDSGFTDGWAGTNSHYCYIDFAHGAIGCESAR